MAFIIAGLVLLAAAAWAFVQLWAAQMSDVPNAHSGAGVTMLIGFAVAAVIVASHYLHIGW